MPESELPRERWKKKRPLSFDDEPLFLALVKYRAGEDREPADGDSYDLISSKLPDGKHAPILDLDFAHAYVDTSTPGHAHLYLNTPISWWRVVVLLWALRIAKVIEQGFFWWSLRRGATFARRPGVGKNPAEKASHYSYGMFFKLRNRG